jgi:aldehyde dehydrogenase (NAD+)
MMSSEPRTNIHLFIDTMPFGGIGPSGMGHYYGKHGFDALTHARSILVSPPDVAIDHLFPTPFLLTLPGVEVVYRT